jgi:drug/metabolite transporter (DMT)-like permease
VIVGAVSGGFGMNMIKASSSLEIGTPWYFRKRLLLGLFLSTIFNTTLDLISFALTPLTVIAPLGGISIVSAALFSYYGFGGNKETFTRRKVIGIALVVAGIVFVACFGPKPGSAILDADDVLDNFTSTPFAAYQLATSIVLTATVASIFLECLPQGSLGTTLIASYAGGMASGLCQSLIKLFATCVANASVGSLDACTSRTEFLLALVELAANGIILFVLLKTTIESGPNVSVSTCYYSVCVMGCTIVAGALFYKELELLSSAFFACAFFAGIVFAIVGITLVSSESRRGAPQKIPTKEEVEHPNNDDIIE